MREGVAYDGLSFPDTGCHVPDAGFNHFTDLYHMLEMIDIL